jgi:uncharacterized membrane protein YoaK (UPF0700 family)
MNLFARPRPEPSELSGLFLAVLLSSSAGAVDVIAYLKFNHVFVANMTGNTVLFGADIVAQNFFAALEHLMPIIGFLAGVMVARLFIIREAESSPRVGPSSQAGLCFLLASGVWTIVAVLTPSLGSWLIPVLAFSMGAQNASFTKVGRVPVNTAFITGDLEKLGEAVANLWSRPSDAEELLKVRAVGSIWIAYAIGGILGAFAAWSIGRYAFLWPAGVLCLSASLAFGIHWRIKKEHDR